MHIQEAAEALLQAEQDKTPIAPFTSSTGSITVEDAYRIQLYQINKKVGEGARIIGKKIGLTSKVMQEMFDVQTPDYGHILDDMVYEDGSTISIEKFIQPKVEFEIAFVLKEDLQGPNVTVEDVYAATDYVVPAIEIIDSRIEDWKFKFEDTVADNGSSAGAVIGKKKNQIQDINLAAVEMQAYKNDAYLDGAKGEAVMGNPANAVAWLANAVGEYGISLHKGEVILAGALSKAVAFEAGDHFNVDFGQMGSVSISFSEGGR